MPHSWPATTSRASSLKRLSWLSLPSWITTLSRIRRTFAPRSTLPSVTRQPAILPTFETRKISRIRALPSMDDARRDLLGAEFVERADDRFDRALHIGLDDQREFLEARGLHLRHHLL